MCDHSSTAALQLLRSLAAQGVAEAAAFLQQQQPPLLPGPLPPLEQHWDAGAATAVASGGRRMLEEGHHDPLSGSTRVAYIIICILLVAFAGMMAGLTLGLLSLDRVDLEVIRRSGSQRQQWLVSQVEPVLARPHYLLATLLLCNAGAMEALPIFLDRLLNPLAAILISVTAILVFGEVVPQAACKKYGLQVGAYLAWPVRLLMLLTAPITWPISKLLDHLLGEESALFRRHELKALVDIHAEGGGEDVAVLTVDEAQVIQGALDMATKTAQAAMTPIHKVFMLPSDAEINAQLLHEVISAGHSRLPVYGQDRQNILGLVLVKELVLVDETAGVRVRDLRLREVPFIRADIPMYDALKIFRMGRSHMAILTNVTGNLESETIDGPTAAAAAAAQEGGVGAAAAGPVAEGTAGKGMGKPRKGRGKAAGERIPLLSDGSATGQPRGYSSDVAADSAETGLRVGAGADAGVGNGNGSGSGNGNGASSIPGRQTTSNSSDGAGVAGMGGLVHLAANASASSQTVAAPHREGSLHGGTSGGGAGGEIVGIITIEDVLEELLQAEILDETDRYEDNLQTVQARRLLTIQHLPPHLRRFLTRSLAASGSPSNSLRVTLTGGPAAGAEEGEGRPHSAAAVLQLQAGSAAAAGLPPLPAHRSASAVALGALATAKAAVELSAQTGSSVLSGAQLVPAGQTLVAALQPPAGGFPPLQALSKRRLSLPRRAPPADIPRRRARGSGSNLARESELVPAVVAGSGSVGPSDGAGAPPGG